MKKLCVLFLLTFAVSCAKRERWVENRLQPNARSEEQIVKIITTDQILREENLNEY